MTRTLPKFLTHPDPSIFLKGRGLYLDFETTALDNGSALNPRNKLLLACWRTADGILKHKWGQEYDQQELLEDISKHDYIVAHQSKFELAWLQRCGIDLRKVLVFDTMLAEWVIGGNQWQLRQLGLSTVLERYGLPNKDPVGDLIRMGIDPEDIPPDWLLDYCFQDVEVMVPLKERQLQILLERSQLHLVYARGLLTPVLADMEAQGLTLDPTDVYAEHVKVTEEHANLEARLDALADGVNWNSPKQVAAFLYDTLGFQVPKGKDGKPARRANKETLEGLRATTAAQKEFVAAYKDLAKSNARLTKSLNFFKGVCEHYDCTFYGILNQGTVASHRLSSSGRKIVVPPEPGSKAKPKELSAQLQNIPREYKRFFRAKNPDWVMMEADGAGIEFRCGIEQSQDPVGIAGIIGGEDVHSITRDTLIAAGKPGMKADKEGRQDSKPVTFSPMYGGGGKDQYERVYVDFFRGKYRTLYETQMKWTYEVLNNKFLVTDYGMRFYWPKCEQKRSGYISHTTEIFNYPNQGFATGEIIPITLIWLWHMTEGMQIKLVLTVHDSVIAEVHPDEVETLKPIVAQCFTTKVYETLQSLYGYTFREVPLACEIKFGERWGSGTGIKVHADPSNPGELVWE